MIFSSLPVQSFWFGILSAASLPIGAILGILLTPPKRVVAAIMAFGAGSLLAALTLELVAPAYEHGGFPPLATGAIIGGLLFVGLNQLLNGKGAFLRKPATIVKHLTRAKRAHIRDMVEHLSEVDVLRALPPSEIKSLIHHVHHREFSPGTVIFKEGDAGDSLYLIESGEAEVVRQGKVIAQFKDGDSFGEMSLLSGEPRNATLRAATSVHAWQILKDDFDSLVWVSPLLLEALRALSEKRLKDTENLASWRREVMRHADSLSISVTDRDVREATHTHRTGGAAFAIWLGILLDGIPESAVIGASMVQSTVSWTLIIGLFLANFPEAMSSAIGMRVQRASTSKIIWMWTSLMLMTGIGALLGNIFFRGAPNFMFSLFEGCAAGAMLVMVAETMLPEAYEQGGAVVGISTLLGFLAALFVKSLG
jgi:CRP-like cAMP-binding protein